VEQITAEQAEPQGSAASEQAASAPDFGALFKAHVFKTEAPQGATQSEASSADPETSAADEQPGVDASQHGTPATSTDGDGTPADATPQSAADQPKLSRSQRKALHQQSDPSGRAAQPATADTSAQTTPSPAPAADPVERVERAVTEGLSRLESLIRAPDPSQTDQSLDAASQAYRQTFGDDQEFGRRALIATRPSGDVYLSADEAAELERWSVNREVKQQIDGNYQRNLAATAIAKAQAHGIDPQSVLSTPQFADTYDVFLAHGKKLGAQEAQQASAARIAKLEAANRQLADENEALLSRAPASARPVLTGGLSASGRAASSADRQSMSGRDLLRRGVEAQTGSGAPRRPGGRS
jgi:hypothetical protein